jgi:hypothetical protein
MNRDLLEKFIFKKFNFFLKNEKVHCHVQNSQPRPYVKFCDMLFFYSEEFLAPLQRENHPLFVVCNCLFITFTNTQISEDCLFHPQLEDVPSLYDKGSS